MDYALFYLAVTWKKIPVKYISKGHIKGTMRNLCKNCQKRPVAINYYKEGKAFYRSRCDHCARGHQDERPLWALAGYKKKSICDKCGFKSPHPEIFNVFYVDGDLTNQRFGNLKTVCSNCAQVLHKEGVRWRQGDLVPDL
jgi:hypothetical protein